MVLCSNIWPIGIENGICARQCGRHKHVHCAQLTWTLNCWPLMKSNELKLRLPRIGMTFFICSVKSMEKTSLDTLSKNRISRITQSTKHRHCINALDFQWNSLSKKFHTATFVFIKDSSLAPRPKRVKPQRQKNENWATLHDIFQSGPVQVDLLLHLLPLRMPWHPNKLECVRRCRPKWGPFQLPMGWQ